jgi:hypothetical protein
VTAATPLRALASADLCGWPGLPPGLTLDEAGAELPVVCDVTGRARLGAARAPVEWVASESSLYAGGLRLYVDGGEVLVVEGRDPVGPAGDPLGVPELGEPELVLDALVGPLGLDGVEHVYPERGLAVRLGPGDALRSVLGFAPTTAADYLERLRPEQVARSPFPLRPEKPL